MPNCDCIRALQTPTELPGKKGLYRFLDSGLLMNLQQGTQRRSPVLRTLKEGKDGRLTVSGTWLEIKFCPVCGQAVEAEEIAPDPTIPV